MKKNYLCLLICLLMSSSISANLIIRNDNNDRQQIYDYLGGISQDLLTMDHNGRVTWNYPHWWNTFSTPTYGTRLVRQLINSNHTTTIRSHNDSYTQTRSCNSYLTIFQNGVLQPGSGSGSDIYINVNETYPLLVYNGFYLAPNTMFEEHINYSRMFLLAHEMIHALQMINGIDTRYDNTQGFTHTGDVHVTNFIGFGDLAYYRLTETIDWNEESVVGFDFNSINQRIPGFRNLQGADITENRIRQELGYARRGMYADRTDFNVPTSQSYNSVFTWTQLGTRTRTLQDLVDDNTSTCSSTSSRSLLRNEENEISTTTFINHIINKNSNNLEFIIKGLKDNEKVSLVIYDSYRKKVSNGIHIFDGTSYKVSLNGFNPGTYYYVIKSKSVIKKGKFIY